MENLKDRISDALEQELGLTFDGLGIRTGDITPLQHQKWEQLTQEMASLFQILIDQNK